MKYAFEGRFDFTGIDSGSRIVDLECADLSKVTSFYFGPNVMIIKFGNTTGLKGIVDLRKSAPNVIEVNFNGADLSKVMRCYLGERAKTLHFNDVIGLHGTMNVEKMAPNADRAEFKSCNLENVKINYGKKIEYIDLSYTTGLHGRLNFAKNAPNAKKIDMQNADLLKVKEIVISDTTKIIGLSEQSRARLLTRIVNNGK